MPWCWRSTRCHWVDWRCCWRRWPCIGASRRRWVPSRARCSSRSSGCTSHVIPVAVLWRLLLLFADVGRSAGAAPPLGSTRSGAVCARRSPRAASPQRSSLSTAARRGGLPRALAPSVRLRGGCWPAQMGAARHWRASGLSRLRRPLLDPRPARCCSSSSCSRSRRTPRASLRGNFARSSASPGRVRVDAYLAVVLSLIMTGCCRFGWRLPSGGSAVVLLRGDFRATSPRLDRLLARLRLPWPESPRLVLFAGVLALAQSGAFRLVAGRDEQRRRYSHSIAARPICSGGVPNPWSCRAGVPPLLVQPVVTSRTKISRRARGGLRARASASCRAGPRSVLRLPLSADLERRHECAVALSWEWATLPTVLLAH
jgi:hypothetical protein